MTIWKEPPFSCLAICSIIWITLFLCPTYKFSFVILQVDSNYFDISNRLGARGALYGPWVRPWKIFIYLYQSMSKQSLLQDILRDVSLEICSVYTLEHLLVNSHPFQLFFLFNCYFLSRYNQQITVLVQELRALCTTSCPGHLFVFNLKMLNKNFAVSYKFQK